MISTALLGLAFLAIGVAYYSGITKSWAESSIFTRYTFLGFAWLGAGLVFLGASMGLEGFGHQTLTRILTVIGTALWAVGAMGLIWLPRTLRPRWLDQQREVVEDGIIQSQPQGPQPTASTPSVGAIPEGDPLHAVEPLSGAALPIASGWAIAQHDGYVAAVGPAAVATAGGTTFQPSINLLASPLDAETGPLSAGVSALAAVPLAASNAHVLAYDVWQIPGAHDARRLQFVYSQGDIDIDVIQVVAVTDAHAVTVTASRAVAQHTQVRADIEHMLAGLRIEASA